MSAHIKALEEAFDLTLFERTSRGMSLTADGQRLLAKAERTLGAHQELMAEATRIKGWLTGKLRLGAGSNSNHEIIGKLLTKLSEHCPDVEVALVHGTSADIVTGIRKGSLDAGFYNEAGEPDPELTTIEVSPGRWPIQRPRKAKFSDGTPSCLSSRSQRSMTIVAPMPTTSVRKTNSNL